MRMSKPSKRRHVLTIYVQNKGLHRNYSELVGGLPEFWYVEDVGNGGTYGWVGG